MKDMSRYMPLLAKSDIQLSLFLNNIIDPALNLTGKYEVTLSARFYEPTPDFPAALRADKIMTLGHATGIKIHEKHIRFPKVRGRMSSLLNNPSGAANLTISTNRTS